MVGLVRRIGALLLGRVAVENLRGESALEMSERCWNSGEVAALCFRYKRTAAAPNSSILQKSVLAYFAEERFGPICGTGIAPRVILQQMKVS